jgi:hypothetical protein
MTTEYEHALAVLDLQDNFKKHLASSVIKLTQFVTVLKDDLRKELLKKKMHSGDMQDVLFFQEWYLDWLVDPAKTIFKDDFKEDIWTAFIVAHQKKMQSAMPVTVNPTGTAVVPVAKTAALKVATSLGSFKWDTKSVPAHAAKDKVDSGCLQ